MTTETWYDIDGHPTQNRDEADYVIREETDEYGKNVHRCYTVLPGRAKRMEQSQVKR